MKIANIIYENELVNHDMVEYVNYINIVIEYDNIDKSLPTLYVGWSFMKFCNPNNDIIQNANILDKKIITNELYWECSFEESKGSHVKGVNNFIKSAPQFYFKPKYNYINLDPIFFQLKEIDDLMDVITKKMDATYNYKNEMIYVLFNDKISGIDLNIYKYFQFNTEELITRLNERTNTIHTDLDGEIYQSYYKILPNFIFLKKYIIAILSK